MRRSFRSHRRALWALPITGLLAATLLVAQSVPRLNIRSSGTNQIQITWPPGTNFSVLQKSFDLAGTNEWFDVPEPPSPLGLDYSVHDETTNISTFYRL